MSRRHFSPDRLRAPFGRYHQAVWIGNPERLLVLSGQLAVRPDGSVPEDAEAQARLILDNIDACLAEASMARADLLRLTAYVTEAEHRLPYMRARDAWVADPPPASTLVVVKALALPECKVEVEAVAGR